MPTLENRLGAAAQLTEITHRLTPRFYLESLRIATRIPHCVNVSLGVTHVEHGKRVKIHIGTSKESQPKTSSAWQAQQRILNGSGRNHCEFDDG